MKIRVEAWHLRPDCLPVCTSSTRGCPRPALMRPPPHNSTALPLEPIRSFASSTLDGSPACICRGDRHRCCFSAASKPSGACGRCADRLRPGHARAVPADTRSSQEGSLRPSEQGIAVAKDIWLVGIGLALVIDEILERSSNTRSSSATP